ncbi:acyl-CoA dehydrogenase family protein [Mycobacterium sp. 050128]|uniref:acyl-CoA dehydrogenase family protein n=1 Tax=Mycobacterium sp. 050128 TaxID=3096112 RepID=UPI002EDA8A4C
MPVLSAVERAALGASVRAACGRLLSEERLRYIIDDAGADDRGFDRELWRALCQQVGVASVAVSEGYGVYGYGVTEQAAIAHELGRVLAPVPFLSSAVLATALLAAGGDPANLLADVSAGNCTAAVAVRTRQGRLDRMAATPAATCNGSLWRLSGSVRHVLGAASAAYILVVADNDGQPEIFVVDRDQPNVVVAAERVLDATRPMASVTFDAAAAQRLTPNRAVVEVVDDSLLRTIAVLTAEQVGATERVLQNAVQYARTRRQFDRAIGSFQAVKHRCADMLVDLELARSASMAAVQAVDEANPDATWRTSMAKAICSEALRNAAHANLQIHGGIGFTWEHAAGLYVKRARTDEVLFGRPAEHWNLLADAAALVAETQDDERGANDVLAESR